MRAQSRLIDKLCRELPPTTLTWIGVRPGRKVEMVALKRAQLLCGRGIEGDHRCDKTPGSARQVTLISQEFIDQVARHLGVNTIDPAQLRRNLVVSGLNLNVLRHQTFKIGSVLFEATASCHPCARMETTLGKGGLAAMLGYGGLCAKILSDGEIAVGDSLIKVSNEI